MSETTWGKPQDKAKNDELLQTASRERWKFLLGGVLMLGAVVYLLVSGTAAGAHYFVTVESLVANPEQVGETVRVSGAVIGDSIVYDGDNLILDFTVAHIPEDVDDLAHTLYLAANDPNAITMPVHMENEVKPDLLTHEAQAILTGELGDDGVFYASELLLKCPSRYDEKLPEQVQESHEPTF